MYESFRSRFCSPREPFCLRRQHYLPCDFSFEKLLPTSHFYKHRMHLRLATLADCSATASLSVPSFHNDELFAWINPRREEYPDHFRYYFLRRHQMRYWSSEQVFYVAVTDEQDKDWSGDSQVIGYAIWQRRGDSETAKSWRKPSLRSRKSFVPTLVLYACVADLSSQASNFSFWLGRTGTTI